MNIQREKEALRKKILEKILRLTPEERAASDARIAENILRFPEYRTAGTVFLFAGREWEIDTGPLLNRALQSGKRVGVPLCVSRGVMEVRQISSLQELIPGKYKILEPSRSCPLIPPEEIELSLIPCVSCDRNGNRLGFGAGFYDRYLPKTRCFKAALCREALLADQIPSTETDIRMDAVVTDSGVLLFGR